MVTIVGALLVALVMVLSALAAMNVAVAAAQARPTAAVSADAGTPWTYPTTTMEEPNYTGGVFINAADTDVEYLNVWRYSDLYSGILIDELYDSADNYVPNETYVPWAASSYVESAPVAPGTLTFDPLNGAMEPVAYTWNVTLRPNIQWSDWTPAGASSTYLYSNHTEFTLCESNYPAPGCTVTSFSHTYSWPSVRMNTYTMQSADLILSWLILSTSFDYSSEFPDVVNVIPTSNLTAEFMLSAQSAAFVPETIDTPILPYHSWQPHDCASEFSYAWNFSSTCPSSGPSAGYDVWNMGYNPSTGLASDLIGTGPFMFTNSYGEPQGSWVVGDYWELYVNPHYFVQYTTSLRQFTPKIFELYTPLYLSESDAVTAFLLGQVDTIENGVDPTYIPTIETDPSAAILYEPPGDFGFIQLNSWGNYTPIPGTSFAPEVTNAPFNITTVRQAMNYATNKAYIASVVDEGYSELGQPVIPTPDATWHNFTANEYPYNPTMAESMLASVPGMVKNPTTGDWSYDGTPVTLNIQTTVASEDPVGVEENEVVAQEWTAIGIPTTVTQEAFASLLPPFFYYGYSGVSLGITGIDGDPTAYFLEVYNDTIGEGTGFYNGPFSSLTWNGTSYTGYQIDSLMGNLTNELNTYTNLAKRIQIADEIEGIAADESVIINLGYGVGIVPFDNATFTGFVNYPLPYAAYIEFNDLSVALKTPTKVVPPSAVTTQLKVGLVAPTTNFVDGQFGNVTVQVRNQYGQPESGMSVAMSYSPFGMLLNVSSDLGVSNSNGTYTWEFQVLAVNTGIWTADYGGEINISAAATPPASEAKTVESGLGWTFIDVSPVPVAFYATNDTVLVPGGSTQTLNIEVHNPLTGAPIPNYAYTVEALLGAVNLTRTSSAQSIEEVSDYLAIFQFGYASVLVTNATEVTYSDYNLTAISGVTGANGMISVDVQGNGTSNLSANGNPFQTWLFIGAYQATAPVAGLATFGSIGEVSSSFDALLNGYGYGTLQPAEIPLTIATAPAPGLDVSLSLSSTSVGPTGTVTVTAKVTNSTTDAAVPNAEVTVYLQNDFGANRGYLVNTTGTDVEVPNPNEYFASIFLPGIQMVTAANGEAISTFSPGLYTAITVGGVLAFRGEAYTDPYLIPADDWEVSAYATNATTGLLNSTTADAQIASTQVSTPATPSPVAAVYLAGSVVSANGVVSVKGGSTYTLFVNTTENTPAGPIAPDVNVIAISTSYGTVTPSSGATSSAGSLSGTLAVPSTTVQSVIYITVEYAVTGGTANVTQAVYVVPAVTPTTTTTNLDIYYALIGLFAVLTVIFLALWISARGRPPLKATTPWSAEGGASETSPGGAGTSPPMGPGSGGSSGPPPSGGG